MRTVCQEEKITIIVKARQEITKKTSFIKNEFKFKRLYVKIRFLEDEICSHVYGNH